MEFKHHIPPTETTPELWINPYTIESFSLVDAACDRWLRRRDTLRRRAHEHNPLVVSPASLGPFRRAPRDGDD
jgi:hypothetical protein